MRIGADCFQIMLVGKERVRGSDKATAQIGSHGLDDVFLPQKAVATASSEIGNAKTGNTAQAFNLAPQLGLRRGVEDVEMKFAQSLQVGPGSQLVQDGEGVEFPHRRISPQTVEGQMKLTILDRQRILRQF